MNKQVVFIAPIYRYRPILPMALTAQTHQDWRLYLVHDGPSRPELEIHKYIAGINDPRITYIETERRAGTYGHPIRKKALQDMRTGRLFPDASYIVITNGDNYHCPTFCEWLLSAFQRNTVATYCQWIPHNYFGYAPMTCQLQLGAIDICGCMIRKDVACEVGWNGMMHSADWVFLNDIISKFGRDAFKVAHGALATHN